MEKQQRNLPAPIERVNTCSTLDFFRENKKQPTFRQIDQWKINDDHSGYSGVQLARYLIGQELQHIYQIIGLKPENEPSKTLAVTIAKYIQNTYHYFTPSDLFKAFEFALQDKYKCGKDHLEHYQVMDLKYINRVLSAYKNYRREMVRKATEKTTEDKLSERLEELISSRSKDDAAVKRLILHSFALIKESNGFDMASRYIKGEFWDWLLDIGIVKNDRQIESQARKIMIEDRVEMPIAIIEVKKRRLLDFFKSCHKTSINPFQVRFEEVCYINDKNISEVARISKYLKLRSNE